MVIGSIRGKNITDENGYTVPDVTGITANNSTVHFGDWNDYYYCELVANSLASYTHDYQFSRLTNVDSVDVDAMTYTVDGKTAAFRDFKTEIANGTLAKLPSIKDAFSRFVYLSAVGGMNVCPYPNQFNGTTAAQYFAGGDMALLVEKISNFGNIGKIMKDTWSVAPMPQYKEYTDASDPSCDDVKVAGKTAGHSLGYSLAINNKADARIQEAAKKFVKWFATDGQAFLASKGYVSSRVSDAQASLDGLAAKYANPEVILTSVQNASAGDWWYMTDNNWITTWSNPLNNEVRYGKKSLEDFLYAYIEATNNALATYK
jgi:hypothetical protein